MHDVFAHAGRIQAVGQHKFIHIILHPGMPVLGENMPGFPDEPRIADDIINKIPLGHFRMRPFTQHDDVVFVKQADHVIHRARVLLFQKIHIRSRGSYILESRNTAGNPVHGQVFC